MSGGPSTDGPGTGGRSLHALVVGVDHYEAAPAPGGRTIPHLAGCVRDARRVEVFLRDRLGVRPQDLEVLLSPNPPAGGDPAAPGGEPLPTLDNLLAAFERLAARAAPGDAVLIHFSGHGVRVRTAFPQWKGEGRDEALVPCDAAAAPGGGLRVLRDLELAALLRHLAARGLEVSLVLDCCHAGGAVRGEGIRCPVELSAATLPAAPPRLAPPELEAAWKEALRERPVLRAFEAGSGWLPARGVVLLAACAADEYAWERHFPEGKSGVLTHCLLDELSRPVPVRTWRRLADRLVARAHGLGRHQTPQIEGDVDRPVLAAGGLAAERLAVPWSVRVLAAEEDGTVVLDAGRVHGVGPGSLFALSAGKLVAEVREAERVISRARLIAPSGGLPGASSAPGFAASGGGMPLGGFEPRDLPEPGDLAVPLGPRPRLRRTVAARADVPAALAARVDRAAGALDSQFLRWSAEPATADLVWGVDGEGRFEVRDGQESVLRLEPPLSAAAPGAAGELVARLDHLARFLSVEALENHDPRSPLAGRLELELGRLPDGYQQGDALDTSPLPTRAGMPAVRAGEWVCLRIHNRSDRRLHVALLALTSSWAVRQVTTGPEIGGAELIDPRSRLAVPLLTSVPPGRDEVRDVLKVLAAPRATSFRWLELPALAEAPRGSGRRRDFDAPPAGNDWTSAQIVVRVVA